jgi:hypothetical protein
MNGNHGKTIFDNGSKMEVTERRDRVFGGQVIG